MSVYNPASKAWPGMSGDCFFSRRIAETLEGIRKHPVATRLWPLIGRIRHSRLLFAILLFVIAPALLGYGARTLTRFVGATGEMTSVHQAYPLPIMDTLGLEMRRVGQEADRIGGDEGRMLRELALIHECLDALERRLASPPDTGFT